MTWSFATACSASAFGYAGLIGSATKWARFRKRLATLGHSEAQIDQIACPIGDPALGKQPHEIAVGRGGAAAGAGRARDRRVREDVA